MPSIAVVGASSDTSKFGNKCVRAHLQQGWTVYPVNPKGGEIEGLPVLTSLSQLPGPVDQVSLYLPPAVGLSVLEDIAATEHGSFFVNPGSESDALIARAKELGLDPIQACAIVGVGVNPATL